MDRALPLNVREKNLLQIKEAIINESYKTTSEIVDGCKTAIGFLFEEQQWTDHYESVKLAA